MTYSQVLRPQVASWTHFVRMFKSMSLPPRPTCGTPRHPKGPSYLLPVMATPPKLTPHHRKFVWAISELHIMEATTARTLCLPLGLKLMRHITDVMYSSFLYSAVRSRV